jgi:hypothetical protein
LPFVEGNSNSNNFNFNFNSQGFRSFGASYLSLLVQRKVTQRNTPQSSRPSLRYGSTAPAGFSDAASMPRQKTTCIHARRPFGVSPAGSVAADGGPGKTESKGKITSNGNGNGNRNRKDKSCPAQSSSFSGPAFQ